jgi:hypothetical protein
MTDGTIPTPGTGSAVLVIEGQRIPIPTEIAVDDDKVRRALAPFFPGAASAEITRAEQDSLTTVTVVKRAGSKGHETALLALRHSPGGKNPAIALFEEIQTLEIEPHEREPEALLTLEARIQRAIETGQSQAGAVERARERLAAATARPAPAVVLGF